MRVHRLSSFLADSGTWSVGVRNYFSGYSLRTPGFVSRFHLPDDRELIKVFRRKDRGTTKLLYCMQYKVEVGYIQSLITALPLAPLLEMIFDMVVTG